MSCASFRTLLISLALTAAARSAEAPSWRQLPALPEPLGVAAPFAGVAAGALLVAGGANFPDKMPWEGGRKVWHDRVWLLERPEGVWREAGRLPRPLAYGVSATTPDGIVCVGGSDADRHYADCFRLAIRDGKLVTEPLPALPIALANHCGALVGSTLFIAGGANEPGEQAASKRCFALDLTAAKAGWREVEPLPGEPRLLGIAAADGRDFTIFGGVALAPNATGKMSRVYLRDTWRYRSGEGWQRRADAPKPIAAAASPAPRFGSEFLLLAGDDGSRVAFTPVEKHPGFPPAILAYDPAHDRWREAGEVPAPRATLPCVAWRDLIVLPSGEVRLGVRSPEVWAFPTH
jgi:N-acetylneuraminate epimerase